MEDEKRECNGSEVRGEVDRHQRHKERERDGEREKVGDLRMANGMKGGVREERKMEEDGDEKRECNGSGVRGEVDRHQRRERDGEREREKEKNYRRGKRKMKRGREEET